MFRHVIHRELILPAALALSGAACLREIPPSSAVPTPPVSTSAVPSKLQKTTEDDGTASAHDLFISALVCFGAPVYLDAIGVEPRHATSTIDRACAPLERAAAEAGVHPDDEDAYVGEVRAAVEHRSMALDPVERRELLDLFDKGLDAVREARSPWGFGPWSRLVELVDTLHTRSLHDEARALATWLEADRLLRSDPRKPASGRVLVDLEARLTEQSSHLDASDLRTAIDGFVQRIRTMI